MISKGWHIPEFPGVIAVHPGSRLVTVGAYTIILITLHINVDLVALSIDCNDFEYFSRRRKNQASSIHVWIERPNR